MQKRIIYVLIGFFLQGTLLFGQTVDMNISTNDIAEVGEIFTVEVWLDAGTTQVTGAATYLNFDPSILQVDTFVASPDLLIQLPSSFDNTQGFMDYAAGKFSDFPTGDILLVTVLFQVVGVTSNSTIEINTDMPRPSDVNNIDAMNIIGLSPDFNFSVEGSCPPNLIGQNKLTGTISIEDNFIAASEIESDQLIMGNAIISYSAGDGITLLEGFSITTGAELFINTIGCN